MFEPYYPVVATGAVLLAGLFLLHYLLIARRRELGSEALLPRQLLLFFLTLASLITLVVIAPIQEEATRERILSIIGLLISAVVALSSTSFVTNFMAAIMLRVTQPFTVGDFITVSDHFGKVAERGLFDTEIQTESGELIAIPNAVFITSAVKVIDRDSTIISTTLSLGYDTHHSRIERLLIDAANSIGLSDSFVLILELGDFSVTYRLSGLLPEAKTLITARSKLNTAVLDTLHGAGIEIMSPTFTRHIPHPAEQQQIPVPEQIPVSTESPSVEDIAFAKANQAEELEALKLELQAEVAELNAKIVDAVGDEKARLQSEIKSLESKLAETQSPATSDDK